MRGHSRGAASADKPICPPRGDIGPGRKQRSSFEAKAAPGKVEGALSREDLVGGCRMLEALRELHGISEHRLAATGAQHGTGVDADAQRQLDVVTLLEGLVLFPQGLEHREPGLERAAGCCLR